MMKNLFKITLMVSGLLLQSCTDFLDIKPNKNLVIPEKIADFQALLDNSAVMNNRSSHLLGEISADDYYVLKTAWQALNNAYEKNAYVWAADIFEGNLSSDWNNASYIIFLTNLALEGLEKIDVAEGQADAWNNVRGSALFFRANAQYQMAQLFCQTYIPGAAATSPGIPLRLESDITVKTVRSSVEETYRRIVKDLQEAAELLPITPVAKTRPSKPAANALLARVYLQMQDYERALQHASLSWKDYHTLTDFNSLDARATYPFKLFNEEVIFHSNIASPPVLNPTRHSVSQTLFDSYDSNDLRKVCYYTVQPDKIRFKGSYNGSNAFFTGISTGEVLITLAECHARTGNTTEAVNSLEKLLQARYKQGTLKTVEIKNELLLELILTERRKELPFRGIRWSDLKRFNTDPRFAKPISRVWEDETITLEAGSLRYIFPIPDQVIKLTGIEQNKR